METRHQNTHFFKHFGRNGFEVLDTREDVRRSVEYIMKYIRKTGEKLVYGGKLPTYFLSDILEDDIICGFGVDDRKCILFDDFLCIVDGEVIGKVSPEVIKQMPKSN